MAISYEELSKKVHSVLTENKSLVFIRGVEAEIIAHLATCPIESYDPFLARATMVEMKGMIERVKGLEEEDSSPMLINAYGWRALDLAVRYDLRSEVCRLCDNILLQVQKKRGAEKWPKGQNPCAEVFLDDEAPIDLSWLARQCGSYGLKPVPGVQECLPEESPKEQDPRDRTDLWGIKRDRSEEAQADLIAKVRSGK